MRLVNISNCAPLPLHPSLLTECREGGSIVQFAVIQRLADDGAFDTVRHKCAQRFEISQTRHATTGDYWFVGASTYLAQKIYIRSPKCSVFRHIRNDIAGTSIVIETLEAGADDYLAKPFVETELRARIRNLLRAGEQERKLAELNRELESWNLVLADRVAVMSARTGRFIEIIETGWARDRDSTLASRPEFGVLTSRLWALLRAESQKAMATK